VNLSLICALILSCFRRGQPRHCEHEHAQEFNGAHMSCGFEVRTPILNSPCIEPANYWDLRKDEPPQRLNGPLAPRASSVVC
jgi:hypothetical protein